MQDEKLPQLGAEIQALVSAVPWGHHKLLIDKCGNDAKKALFYVRQTVEGTIPTIAEIESVAKDTVVKPEDEDKDE